MVGIASTANKYTTCHSYACYVCWGHIDIRKEAGTSNHHLESLVHMEKAVSVAPSPGTRRPTASAALMLG